MKNAIDVKSRSLSQLKAEPRTMKMHPALLEALQKIRNCNIKGPIRRNYNLNLSKNLHPKSPVPQ